MDNDKYIGRWLDNRYEIQEVIGTGGMAVVYKARCNRLNRLVAIKILKDEYSQDEEFRRRFHAESQAVAMLSHPNIVSVYDVSTSDEADYLVMELIDGITLKQYMEKKGVLNWKETLHFAIQIAKALEHAHSRGIVHRDIKPHNVMVLKNGSVKVADFGIARVMSKSNTLTKEALGSVHYISPEQAKGGRVDNRSDLYSLGVVMYEMMTGRPPYDGESPVAVAIQHINGGAAMPSTLNPNIPGGLEQIIMKAMAHDPADRYSTATEMLHDMDEFRKDPTILFDSHSGGIDDAIRIRQTPRVPETIPVSPRTTAERVASADSGEPRARREQPPQRSQNPGRSQLSGSRPAQNRTQPPRKRREEEEEEDDSRTRITTIAIVACSAVAVVAIIVFLATLALGWGQGSELVEVPSLLGKDFESLSTYENFEIKLSEKNFNDEYESGQIYKQTPEFGDMVKKGTDIYVYVSNGPKPEDKTMTNLERVPLDQAKQVLIGQGIAEANILTINEASGEYEAGVVIRTEPAEGAALTEGQIVKLWVSTGKKVETGTVPSVVGWDEERARTLLEANGFKNIEVSPVESDKPAGQVIRQSVEKDTLIDVTTLIIIEVSTGPKTAPVPNVMGLTREQAYARLTDAGFTNVDFNEVDSDAPAGQVVNQSVLADTQAELTRLIIIEVSNGSGGLEPAVEKRVVIELGQLLDEAGVFQLRQNDNLVYETTVAAGQLSVDVVLTGSGIQYYEIWINDIYFDTERVDFTVNE